MATIGLDDVLNIALPPDRSFSAHSLDMPFGAAGRSGQIIDGDLEFMAGSQGLSPPVLQKVAFHQMFSTALGQVAVNAVGNEKRTLAALQRLSVELIAQALRMTGQATEDDRLLVMPASDDRAPVVMLMSPSVSSVEQSRVISTEADLPLWVLSNALVDLVDTSPPSPEAIAFRELQKSAGRGLAELFLIARPQIVLTRRPRMIPLCVPWPAMSIGYGEEISSSGILCRDADGELGVTACYHGTGPVGTEVMVGPAKGIVKLASQVQDLVFIPVGSNFKAGATVGRGGVKQDREPAKADRVRFDGVTNRNRNTRIYGSDNGLLRARPSVQLRVQTDPDTDRGDSGSALLNEHDEVLGFAFERTGYDDYPQFTDWIWAANALRALNLTPL